MIDKTISRYKVLGKLGEGGQDGEFIVLQKPRIEIRNIKVILGWARSLERE